MAQITSNIKSEETTKYSNCEESQNILNGNDPNVVCMIRRKRASNLVVYRANTKVNLKDSKNVLNEENKTPDIQSILINSKQPIDIFWLKLSKDDIKSHRDSGKMDDRVEITKIERKLAYGITCKNMSKTNKKKTTKRSRWRSSIKSKKSKSIQIQSNDINTSTQIPIQSSYKVIFNAVKSLPMILRIDTNDNRPYLFGNIIIDGISVECKLKEIWVTMKKGTFIPKVDYLTIKAVRCDNNQSIEHIMRR